MTYKWESESERRRRLIKLSPAKKLEWLEEMRQLLSHLPKRTLAIRKKLQQG